MKRALSFALAVAMLLGVSGPAYAKTHEEYTQEDVARSGANLVRIGFADKNGKWEDAKSYSFGNTLTVVCDVEDAEDYRFVSDSGSPLYIWAAENNTDSTKNYTVKVDSKYINRWDIEVDSKGTNDMVEEIKISYEGGSAVISAEVAPFLDSLSAKTFSVDVWLTSSGKKIKNTDYTLKGGFQNETMKVYEDDDEIDLYDSRELLLEIKETVREALLHLSCDIDVSMRLLKGKKIYLRATSDIDDDDIDVMDKFGFDDVIKVYSINAKTDATTVCLNGNGDYVYTVAESSTYGKNMKLSYLGLSDDDLPLVDYYLISAKKLDTSKTNSSSSRDDDEDDDDDDVDEPPVDLPPLELPPIDDYMMNPNGGPANATPGINYNPSTGR